MMTQIKGNAESLLSLEKKVDSNHDIAERRFKAIEEKIQQPGWPSTWDLLTTRRKPPSTSPAGN